MANAAAAAVEQAQLPVEQSKLPVFHAEGSIHRRPMVGMIRKWSYRRKLEHRTYQVLLLQFYAR